MKLICAMLLLAVTGNSVSSPYHLPADLTDTVKQKSSLRAVNINYMLRGHFYASSPFDSVLAGYGGWGGSDNNFSPVDKNLPVNNNRFEIYIDANDTSDWGNGYAAYNVYVINGADDTLFFSAQDSRLYMVVEAKDKSGEWKPIEYLPSSWCGNSYHTLFLPKDKYWKFKTPVFTGKIKTSLRIRLSYGHDAASGKKEIVYSNEISGSVNAGQFSKKKEYKPGGLMDPYLE
jgi:hypothetical protein